MFSALDGIGLPEEHVNAAKEKDLPGIAITDHGLNSGWYNMENACKEGEINFLPGVESYFTTDRHVKQKDHGFASYPAHLLLIATNLQGIKNIYKIVSSSYIEGFYGKPRCDWDLLKRFNEGLIATSTCVSGPVGKYIRSNDYDRARHWIVEMQKIFGDRFYLELQPHPFDELIQLNNFLVTIPDIEKVLTNDSHYPTTDDSNPQQISACIATKTTLRNPAITYEHDFSIKSIEELVEEMSDIGFSGDYIDRAAETTQGILSSVNVKLPKGLSLNPGWDNAEKDLDDHLRQGWDQKIRPNFSGEKKREYKARLQYEYDLITTKGFAEYFLVVEDMINAAKNRDVMVGCGRGSSGGSLMSYLLGITEIDPIKWDLPMERFMSPHRGGWKMTFHDHKEITELTEAYWEEINGIEG